MSEHERKARRAFSCIQNAPLSSGVQPQQQAARALRARRAEEGGAAEQDSPSPLDREGLEGWRARAAPEAERVLAVLLENVPVQFALLGADLTYVRVNGPYAAFQGMQPREMEGRGFAELDPCSETLELLRDTLKSGRPRFAPAQPLSRPARPDEAVTYWDSSLVPIPDGTGKPEGLILVRKEVTERIETERALARSQEQLLQAQKMKSLGVLVAGVAHEINNPVNQIMFNTPLLQRIWQDLEPAAAAWSAQHPEATFGGLRLDFLRENMPQLLANMDMAANRIARTVSDLKDFSRTSSMKEKSPVQLNTAVHNAVRLAQTTFKKARTNLQKDLEDPLPLMEGNLQNLEQIVLNLLINAVQAMEGRPGLVRIQTRTSDDRIVLSVRDTGRGIPGHIAQRIFDPFVTNRQGEGGTGLGLSVTDNLVKAHGGDIRFETGEGEGTIFVVSFPAYSREVP